MNFLPFQNSLQVNPVCLNAFQQEKIMQPLENQTYSVQAVASSALNLHSDSSNPTLSDSDLPIAIPVPNPYLVMQQSSPLSVGAEYVASLPMISSVSYTQYLPAVSCIQPADSSKYFSSLSATKLGNGKYNLTLSLADYKRLYYALTSAIQYCHKGHKNVKATLEEFAEEISPHKTGVELDQSALSDWDVIALNNVNMSSRFLKLTGYGKSVLGCFIKEINSQMAESSDILPIESNSIESRPQKRHRSEPDLSPRVSAPLSYSTENSSSLSTSSLVPPLEISFMQPSFAETRLDNVFDSAYLQSQDTYKECAVPQIRDTSSQAYSLPTSSLLSTTERSIELMYHEAIALADKGDLREIFALINKLLGQGGHDQDPAISSVLTSSKPTFSGFSSASSSVMQQIALQEAEWKAESEGSGVQSSYAEPTDEDFLNVDEMLPNTVQGISGLKEGAQQWQKSK